MTVRCCLLMKLQVLAADTRRAALVAEEEQLLSDTLDADENTATTSTTTTAASNASSTKSKASSQQQQQQKQPLNEEQWSANMARLSAIGEELAAIGADAAEGIATVTLLLYRYIITCIHRSSIHDAFEQCTVDCTALYMYTGV
jgi:hypothetical protein